MQFICAIKEMARLIPCLKKRNVVGNPHGIDHHRPKICSNPNFLAHYKSAWTGAHTPMSFNGWNIPLEKVPAFLKSNTVWQNLNLGSVTVFVFLSTFHLTTLLWKCFKFHLRRHYYTLKHGHKWVRPLIWVSNVTYVKWHLNRVTSRIDKGILTANTHTHAHISKSYFGIQSGTQYTDAHMCT